MKAALAVVSALIAILPAAFQDAFGREIRADFVDHWFERVESQHRCTRLLSLTVLIIATTANLLLTNLLERMKGFAPRRYSRERMNHTLRDPKWRSSSAPWRPDSFWHDVRFAVRGLLKQPGFTTAVILLLALGIGANVAMFSVFNQALIRPLPFAEPDNLVLGRATFDGNLNPDMSAYDFFDYRERNQVFESVGAIITGAANVTITGGEEPEQVRSAFVSWDLFPTLGVPTAVGRHFFPSEAEPGGPEVALISGGYWQRRFGATPDVIGGTLVSDGTSLTIVGVMPPGFEFLHDVDLWIPMRRNGPRASSRGWHNWLMVGRLDDGVSIERAQADMDLISAQLAAEYPTTNRDKALLLTELHVAFAEDYRTTVVLLMAAVGLVLLIACGNVASLLLARGAARRSELSVRAALGASTSRLIRQLLTESVVTSTVGGAIGIVLAVWFQTLILHVVPADVPGLERLGMSWPMLTFALALSLTTGVLFGVLPALQAAKVSIVDNVKSGARTTDARGQRFHSGLVIAQVAVSVVLLIGSGLLVKSFARLHAVEPGFDEQNLLTAEIRLPSDQYQTLASRAQFFSTLKEGLSSIPGVSDVAVINQLPIRNPGNNIAVYAADRPPPDPNDRIPAFTRIVLPGYFEAMGIPLVRGRAIESSDVEEAPPVLVINETMARLLFPDEDPIGRKVSIQQPIDYEVVGVVGDVRVEGTRWAPRMVMYGSYHQQSTLTMRVALRTAIEPVALAQSVRDIVWNLDRNIPIVGLTRMEEIIARTVANEKAIALSVALFATVAMLLSALGLYGVLAYYVSRRTREIGLRVALGAVSGDIIVQVMKRGLWLVAAGLLLGVVGAFGATRLLQQLLFDVAATDLITFVTVSSFFAVVAVVACVVPAAKALNVNPITALAAE